MYEKGAVTDRTCQKWFAKLHAGDFSLDDAPQMHRAVEIDNHQMETLTEKNQCSTIDFYQHTPNIPTNKVTGENEKCVFYFKEKKKTYGLFGQLNIIIIVTCSFLKGSLIGFFQKN